VVTVQMSTLGRVFISYRRDDASGTTGRLYDRLVGHLGADRVFMDVDSISPGFEFARVIESAVASCDVVLVVIGDGWLSTTDKVGRRRLDNPNDFVALEIKAGLNRNIPVIPVLVDRAEQVREDELPLPLAGLARRQSVRLDHESFSADVAKLMRVLNRLFGARQVLPRPPAVAKSAAGRAVPPAAPMTAVQPRYVAPKSPVASPPRPAPNTVPRPMPRPRRRVRRLVVGAAVISLIVIGATIGSPDGATAVAGVGDCVAQTGDNSLSKVACTDKAARFRVASRVENKTMVDASLDACKAFPKATSAYWEGESGQPGIVLCLEPV
jgi:TIR domain